MSVTLHNPETQLLSDFLLQHLTAEALLTPLMLFAVGIYFIAGVIKGMLGIGFPTAAVSLLAQVSDTRTAISLVVIPMLVTNAWQVWRSRRVRWVLQSYWLLLVMLLLLTAVFSQVASLVPVVLLTGVLGLIVAIYSASSLYRPMFFIPERLDRFAQLIAGITAGIMAGLTGVWAPPILIYLNARRIGKEAFVATSGVLMCLGSLVLFAGYVNSGLIGGSTMVMSCVLLVPSLLGFASGEWVRGHLSAKRFERLLLWFFLIMGLNLIRRAFV